MTLCSLDVDGAVPVKEYRAEAPDVRFRSSCPGGQVCHGRGNSAASTISQMTCPRCMHASCTRAVSVVGTRSVIYRSFATLPPSDSSHRDSDHARL